jgi:hypothetical protein
MVLQNSFGNGFNAVYLITTVEIGNELWFQTFGGDGSVRIDSVQQTKMGGNIVMVFTNSLEMEREMSI